MKRIIIILCLLFTGCATIDDLHPDNEKAFDVDASYYDVWNVCIDVMRDNFEIIDASRSLGFVLAQSGNKLIGEYVGVFIRHKYDGIFEIEVQSEHRGIIPVKNWELFIANKIKEGL